MTKTATIYRLEYQVDYREWDELGYYSGLESAGRAALEHYRQGCGPDAPYDLGLWRVMSEKEVGDRSPGLLEVYEKVAGGHCYHIQEHRVS